jgi:hypothetical protein
MKLIKGRPSAVHLFMGIVSTLTIFITISVVILEAFNYFPGSFMRQYDTLFAALRVLFIFWLIYSLRFILSFSGGRFGKGIFFISIGGVFFILATLHRLLESIDAPFLSVIMPNVSYSLVVNTLTVFGLVFAAWGMHIIADLFRKHK